VVDELLRWVLLMLGWTYLITESAVFSSFRMGFARGAGPFGTTLIYCPACTGFWVGCGLGAFHLWPWDLGLWAIGESGFGAMAVGAAWSAWRHGNPAYAIEQELIYDEATTREARETNDGD
jgi:hypothetical protein